MAHFDHANRIEALAKALYENGNPQHTAEDRAMLGPFEELDALQQTIWTDLANAAHNHMAAELRDVQAERDVLKATVARAWSVIPKCSVESGGKATPEQIAWLDGAQHVERQLFVALKGE